MKYHFKITLSSCLFAFIISLMMISELDAQSFPTAEVNYAGASEEGTILLEVISYGKNAHLAMEEAQRKAIYILLYRGIPGSQFSKPLVMDEIESVTSHKAFYEELFQRQRYRTFVMEALPVSKFKKKQMVAMVKINAAALRRDLEQNKVIRKLGI